MLDSFNQYRNKNGFINLNLVLKEEINQMKKLRFFSFILGNDIYSFRNSDGIRYDIRELINEEISKQARHNNASYDLAIYNGNIGMLTKIFTRPEEELITGQKLLQYASLNSIDNTLYNYLLALKNDGANDSSIKNITRQMLEEYILDIFTIQNDRNSTNLGFMKKTSSYQLAPRFDSEDSFFSYMNEEEMKDFLKSKKRKETIAELITRSLPQDKLSELRLLSTVNPSDLIIDYWESFTWQTVPVAKKEKLLKNNLEKEIKDTYIIISEAMKTMNLFIDKASQINFEEIYYYFNQYNIRLSNIEREFYRIIYETRVEMFFDQKQKIKNR